MPVMTQTFAKNLRKQVVILSSDPKGTEQVEWQAAGDLAGGDVQMIPDAVLRSPQYRRLIQKGIIVEVTEEQADEALGRQNSDFAQRTAAASEQIASTIAHETNRDILEASCVGPDARNEGKCGVKVPVTQATKDDQPPLCSQHIGLAAQYVPSDTEAGRVWMRAGLGPRETAL